MNVGPISLSLSVMLASFAAAAQPAPAAPQDTSGPSADTADAPLTEDAPEASDAPEAADDDSAENEGDAAAPADDAASDNQEDGEPVDAPNTAPTNDAGADATNAEGGDATNDPSAVPATAEGTAPEAITKPSDAAPPKATPAPDAPDETPDAAAVPAPATLTDDAVGSDADATPSEKKGEAKPGDKKKVEDKEKKDDAPPPPGMLALQGGQTWVFRGSSVTLRNSFAPIGLLRNAELTWNPSYAVTAMVQPRIWFGDIFNLQGYVDVTRELTQSDFTTYDGEFQLSNMWISGAATNFWTIPFIGVGLNAALSAQIPTSKLAWGNTLITTVGATGTAIKAFPIFDLGALIFGYSLNLNKRFHRFTTGENATSLEEGRCATAEFCGIYASTGARNVSWGSSNRLFALGSFFNTFGFFLDGRLMTQSLYPKGTTDGRVSFDPVNPRGLTPAANTRFLTWTTASVFLQPHQALTMSVGISTFHNQLASNGKYRFPGINRFTQVNADLTFNLGGMATLANQSMDYFDW